MPFETMTLARSGDTPKLPRSLRIRSKLRERRPLAVRRHSARVAIRFAILLAGDLFAILLCRGTTALLSGLLVAGYFGGATVIPRVQLPNGSGTLFTEMAVLWLHLTGSYSRHRMLNDKIRILTATLIASAVPAWPFFRHGEMQSAAFVYVSAALLSWAFIVFVRIFSERFLTDVWPGSRGAAPAIIVGHSPENISAAERAVMSPGGDYSFAGYVATQARPSTAAIGTIADLPRIIETHAVEAVILSTALGPGEIAWVLEESLAAGCQLLYPARAVRIPNVRPRLVWHRDQPFFELGAPVLKAQALIAKRIVDIVGAALALVLLFPLFIIIAILIKLDSKGPVFFLQDRAGLGGQQFSFIKFRTMTVDADVKKHELAHLNQTGDPRLFKIRNDPRVSRIGASLRRWSLDELPQFWNVLVGQMSLVGPRPFFESDFRMYEDHHFRRLDAKPGITGLWQVSGRSEILDFEDVVYLDRQYIEQWSFWLDVSIMFRTIPAILRRTGAY